MNQFRDDQSCVSSVLTEKTQADEFGVMIPRSKDEQEIDQLLRARSSIKELMEQEKKQNCNGKEEFLSFDNHSKLLEVNYYKEFIWPTCKQGVALNLRMHEICKKLWKLNYRDYGNYLEATYIFI